MLIINCSCPRLLLAGLSSRGFFWCLGTTLSLQWAYSELTTNPELTAQPHSDAQAVSWHSVAQPGSTLGGGAVLKGFYDNNCISGCQLYYRPFVRPTDV